MGSKLFAREESLEEEGLTWKREGKKEVELCPKCLDYGLGVGMDVHWWSFHLVMAQLSSNTLRDIIICLYQNTG